MEKIMVNKVIGDDNFAEVIPAIKGKKIEILSVAFSTPSLYANVLTLREGTSGEEKFKIDLGFSPFPYHLPEGWELPPDTGLQAQFYATPQVSIGGKITVWYKLND